VKKHPRDVVTAATRKQQREAVFDCGGYFLKGQWVDGTKTERPIVPFHPKGHAKWSDVDYLKFVNADHPTMIDDIMDNVDEGILYDLIEGETILELIQRTRSRVENDFYAKRRKLELNAFAAATPA
jgi:hypothetical protein